MSVSFSIDEILAATGAGLQGGKGNRNIEVVLSGVETDTRSLSPGCLFVALNGERFDAHAFLGDAAAAGASGAVVASGRPRAQTPPEFLLFEVADPLTALGELARAHRRKFQAPVAAVTGSNGKTTTKELVASILETRGPAHKTQGNLNNEVGVPLTLFGLSSEQVAAVVEMGMSNPGEIARLAKWAEPDVGLITSVGAAHLAGMGSMEAIAAAKGELFFGLKLLERQKPDVRAVVNLDDPRVVEQARASGVRSLSYGRSRNAEVRLDAASPRSGQGYALTIAYREKSYPVELPLLGAHNALNATGAFAVGLSLGYTPEECALGLEKTKPHPGRLNPVAGKRDVLVLDDCYNANPASTSAALKTLRDLSDGPPRRRPVAVLGDMLELGSAESAAHRSLGAEAAEAAELLAFFGPRTATALDAAKAKRPGVRAVHFEAMPDLLGWLESEVKPGDLVLVKGSRGMKLERAVDALTGRAPSASAGAH